MPLSKMENQPDYRTERFGKDCTDEMYRRIADTGKGEVLYDGRNFLAMGKKKRNTCDARWE